MVDKVQKIWLDGELVDWDEAKVHILTHSLHYGLGGFEGIRAYKRADGKSYVFRLTEHIDRLFDTCKLALLQPKFSREQISAACLDTLRANNMAEGYLRPWGSTRRTTRCARRSSAGSGGRTSARTR